MGHFLTTSQIAEMYGLAASTVRHYRASGRLVPSRQTPGGHARYAWADVVSALGEPTDKRGQDSPASDDGSTASQAEGGVTGLVSEHFAAPGEHDLRSTRSGGTLAAEIVALGVREEPEPAGGSSQSPCRWGGRLVKPRGRVAA